MRECGARRNGVAVAAATLCILSASVTAVAPAGAAPPPQNRTYFTVFLGLGGPHSSGADCMRFTAAELCTSSGLCGSWTSTEPVGRESAIAFEFAFEDDGVPVEVDGQDQRSWGTGLSGSRGTASDGRQEHGRSGT